MISDNSGGVGCNCDKKVNSLQNIDTVEIVLSINFINLIIISY